MIATQNPIEYHGTYPLPEAQMDRFGMRFELGYVKQDQEVDILTEQNNSHPLDNIQACANKDDIVNLRRNISQIRVSAEIKHYIVNIIRATRNATGVLNGVCPVDHG